MLRYVDSSEMTDWQAYDQLEPIGPQADRMLSAAHLAAFINANIDPKRQKAVQPDDFMPWLTPTVEDARAIEAAKARVLFAQLKSAGRRWEAAHEVAA